MEGIMFPVIDKRETGINLSRIMTMRGITAKNVQDYLNLGCVQSVYRWLDGVNMPSIDNLYALSEFFQMPIDEIVRGNKERIVPGINVKLMDCQTERLFVYYDKLNENQAA